jgi:hypothetical protein
VGNSAGEFPVGRKPIGTCSSVSDGNVIREIGHSHPIGSVRERFDDQLLILGSPFAHHSIRVDDRPDILDGVLPFPSLVVQ